MSSILSFHPSMKSIFKKSILSFSLLTLACQASDNKVTVHHQGDGQSTVRITGNEKYMLLPIEESSPETKLYILSDNQIVQTLYVRLAVKKADYYVPVDLTKYKNAAFTFQQIAEDAACWNELKLSDNYDITNREKYRPAYHFSPTYGWMNDPNGMVYKDGEYHLFYQYNPYGSMWGNMHWGHSVTKDLINWEHLPVAITPDGLGSIFSGSCIVDKDNTAGFGKDAIIAFYTSAGDRQTQSMAYSLDNGRSFKKYDQNPILTSSIRDFRDPKVFWHSETSRWIMIIAASQEMQIYSSSNLKEWNHESSFGDGMGAHGGVWECPDLIRLEDEKTGVKKWALLCNINPGGPYGGSATQYFIGDFNGKEFVNESPKTTKWMDWGKDHYATVTWNNAPEGRHIALGWMSNWQYANNVPTTQFRSANTLPRDLSLYTYNNESYIKSAPSAEVLNLRKKGIEKENINVDRTYNMDPFLPGNNGCYEIELKIDSQNAEVIGWQLFNSKGEEVNMYYNLIEKTFSMDRSKSGLTDFSNEFPALTIAPVNNDKEITVRIFVDKGSMEIFGNEGRFVMTNLVFPTEPYNRISFYAKGGSYTINSFRVYPIK